MKLSKVIDFVESQPKDRQFSKKEIVHHLNSITKIKDESNNENDEQKKKFKPKYLKKGDIVKSMVAYKIRPCVVIKVEKDVVYAIPLSTTEDANNLCKAKSRFLEDNYFSKSIICMTMENAINGYTSIYDNNKHLNEVIKSLKQTLINI